jgi:hypothetical protein
MKILNLECIIFNKHWISFKIYFSMFSLTISLKNCFKMILNIYLQIRILNLLSCQIYFVKMINFIKFYNKLHKISLIISLFNHFKKIRKILIILFCNKFHYMTV